MEYLDLYDENKRLTGEKIIRKKGKPTVPQNNYINIVVIFIQNSEFTRNISCESLLNSINNFSKDFLFYINSDIFSKGDIFDITKFNVYKIYKQILLKINMINNPHFLSYNKDILVQIKANKDFSIGRHLLFADFSIYRQ